jgi:DnaD/phage-associated family protein
MARPQKDGLDYFPLDVDIDQDDKVQLIEAKFGITGFGIIIKLFMKIYKEGYFYEWSEKEQLLFSRRVNVDINQVNDVINECIKWGLFDKNLYEKYRILTSKGIQKRYMEAVSRRKQVVIVKEFFLLDASKYSNIVFVDINGVNVDINTVNDDINPQSKVKKSKVQYSPPTPPQGDDGDDNDSETVIPDNTSEQPNPYTFYEENFGTISSFAAEKIEAMEKEIGPEMVVEAMKIAILNNVRRLNYVDSIIKDWRDHNIRTPHDIEVYEKQRKIPQNKASPEMIKIDYEAASKSKYGW